MSRTAAGGVAASSRPRVSQAIQLKPLSLSDYGQQMAMPSRGLFITLMSPFWTGPCNFGKLNYFVGARAAREGRTALFPTIDFCKDPGVSWFGAEWFGS